MYSVALFMGFPETGADKNVLYKVKPTYVAWVAIEHPSLSGLSRPSSTIQQETTRHTASTDMTLSNYQGFGPLALFLARA